MKKLLYLAFAAFVAILLNSCASNNHLELVGHYKPNTDVAKTNAGHSENTAQQIASLPEKNSDMALNSAEAQPDLHLLNANASGSAEKISLSGEQNQKAEKKLTKRIQQIEKKAERKGYKSPSYNSATSGESLSHRDDSQVLYAILAILLPPLAVALYEDGITVHFWISILLTLLFWIPGVIYALIIIFGG